MQKSTLSLYIQKVSEGDRSFLARLCAQLADRILYVPTKAQAKSGQRVKVSIFRLSEEGKTIIPVFTTEKKLKDWALHGQRTVDSISLLGADFCSALDGESSIWVDAGSEPSVKLPPEIVREITMAGGSGDYTEIASAAAPPRKEMEPPKPAAPSPTGLMASFPVDGGVNGVPPSAPSPSISGVKKEDFPPFVPPSVQPAAETPHRGIEQREPPPYETIRAPRSSLAAGVLMGEPLDPPISASSTDRPGEPRVNTPAEEGPVESKKKGIFGLFSKK
ncbi:MAG: SseB protein N-terminal domain [Pseudomonadota bacterium]|jgi:hypothetical protein